MLQWIGDFMSVYWYADIIRIQWHVCWLNHTPLYKVLIAMNQFTTIFAIWSTMQQHGPYIDWRLLNWFTCCAILLHDVSSGVIIAHSHASVAYTGCCCCTGQQRSAWGVSLSRCWVYGHTQPLWYVRSPFMTHGNQWCIMCLQMCTWS